MSSRGLLGALLGVAGELPPSVEGSLLSDCWDCCLALLSASSNNASLRELPTGQRFNYYSVCISVATRTHL